MLRFLTEPLDRLAIATACGSIPQHPPGPHQAEEAQRIIEQPDYFAPFAPVAELSFEGEQIFHFASPVATPSPENNVVRGKFCRTGPNWRQRPAVILLHGWNGELGYRWQFPYLAWRLHRAGLNVAMLELPYHAQRKPPPGATVRNFLSHDLKRVAEAVQQSLQDTRALMNWFVAQGCPTVGLWGISLGGWLAGLLACHAAQTGFAVLMTPVVRMDRAFQELAFCAPIRRGLQGVNVPLQLFNLASHRLALPREQVLIVEATHDLFAPVETVEELWSSWQEPPLWRCPHGHISILMSLPIMERTVRWVRKAAQQATLVRSASPGVCEAPDGEQSLQRAR